MKQPTPEQCDALVENLTKMITLHEEMIDNMSQMRQLFLLAKIEPRVVEGRMSWGTRDLAHRAFHKRAKDYELVVRYYAGTPEEGVTRVPLTEAPREFWPEDVRRAEEARERLAERRRGRQVT